MIKRLLKGESGSAYYWIITLIGIVLIGMVYVPLLEVEEYFFNTLSVDRNVGSEQRLFLHNVWVYAIPLMSIGVMIFWALVNSQKRRDF